MVRQYVQVTDEQRRELVRLIHDENYSIARASKATGIPYDNAKAINRTYLRESRIKKINYQQRYLNSKARKQRMLG
jgi:molybdenum-dependent DNA-binding transcriptional regulator ModE